MLVSHRELHSPELGARYVNHMLLHSRFRVLINERSGIIEDETLLFPSFGRRLGVERSELIVCLAGKLRVRRPGFEAVLRPGEWLGENRGSGWYFRRDTSSIALILEWEPGLIGTRHIPQAASGKLPANTFAAVRQVATTLSVTRDEMPTVAPLLRQLLCLLRAEGLPFDDVEEGALIEEVPERMRTLCRTVDAALSSPKGQPMMIDLQEATGRSRLPILSDLQEFNARYSFNAGGWRDVVQRWRMTNGMFLMSAPGATTEAVAARLGYSSPAALCHAFAKRGLPSPGALRETLLRLG